MLEIIKIEDTYFLKADSEFSVYNFIEMIREHNGMKKGSFAESYVIKILMDLISGAVNLGEKYKKYYFEEYFKILAGTHFIV